MIILLSKMENWLIGISHLCSHKIYSLAVDSRWDSSFSWTIHPSHNLTSHLKYETLKLETRKQIICDIDTVREIYYHLLQLYIPLAFKLSSSITTSTRSSITYPHWMAPRLGDEIQRAWGRYMFLLLGVVWV